MPEQGTEGHAGLLVAEELCAHLRNQEDGAEAGVAVSRLEQFLHRCGREHGHRWRRDAREPAGQRQLLRGVLARLEALNLIRCEGEFVKPLPAIARYRLENDENA
jgi:uncharacterized protein (TIGR02678 family)